VITSDALLTLSKDVILRRDPAGLLLFQVRTDEMYFVPHAAAALLKLVDGSRTLGEIEDETLRQHPALDRNVFAPAMSSLFASLAERKVIEVWS
jgi:hypothetical protein